MSIWRHRYFSGLRQWASVRTTTIAAAQMYARCQSYGLHRSGSKSQKRQSTRSKSADNAWRSKSRDSYPVTSIFGLLSGRCSMSMRVYCTPHGSARWWQSQRSLTSSARRSTRSARSDYYWPRERSRTSSYRRNAFCLSCAHIRMTYIPRHNGSFRLYNRVSFYISHHAKKLSSRIKWRGYGCRNRSKRSSSRPYRPKKRRWSAARARSRSRSSRRSKWHGGHAQNLPNGRNGL